MRTTTAVQRRGARTWWRLRSALWLVPLLCLLGAIVLGVGLLAVDRGHPGLVPTSVTGNATAVSTILSTVASSMVTLTTLVLTLTTVAVQLSVGQFSPRIVRALLQDRKGQFAFGLFGATFTISVLAIRGLNQPTGFVPGVTVLVAYLLTLTSLGTLFLYMHHSGQRLGAAGLIDFVGDHLTAEIARLPEDGTLRGSPEGSDGRHVVRAERGGVVDVLDIDGLVAVAASHDCRISVLPRVGDFVPAAAGLAHVHGSERTTSSRLDREVRRCILLTSSRSHTDDPAYGMRKLVDIAERSLASGPFTDPTTAVQALNRLHDALRQLAVRRLPPIEHRDAAGAVRVITRELDWPGFVRLGFDEIRLAGAGSPQVARRLRAALEDLLSVAPTERHEPLQRQLRLLDQGVQTAFDQEEDAAAMSMPDEQGVGSGPDVVQGR